MLRTYWFLVALVALLGVGSVWHEAWGPVADWIPRRSIVAGVLLLMSLTLESGSMWGAVRRPGAIWLAIAVNAGLAPPVAWLFAHLLGSELAAGLIIAASVPCTLASAAVWTRRAGGNDAVALVVTMLTNLASFVVLPAWLALLLSTSVDGGQSFLSLVWRLVQLAVLPILTGQLLRLWRPVAHWADRRKTVLGVVCQLGILSIVLLGAVSCGRELAQLGGEARVGGLDWLVLLAVVVGLHVVLLAAGLGLARLARLPQGDSIAVAIAGSQKTLMVGLDIALVFGGLAILPMVTYHMVQLVIDTVFADRMRKAAPLADRSKTD